MKRRYWTADEIDTLRRLYPDYSAEVVGKVLDRHPGAVHQKAISLKVSKSEAFKASDRSGRIKRGQQHPAMVATRFVKGQAAWNKGLRGVVGVQEACRATQFRKGAKPHNTHEIGSYRLNKDGHLQQKVSDAGGNNSKRWRSVAELVWIAANGPVPPKHLVVFKRGMRTSILEEITAERVECISMAENAHRNHPRNRDPELGHLVQLKGAITRQVNRIAREAQERA